MSGVRRRVTVIGPGATGFLRASYRLEPDECCIDVPVEMVPASLRAPNAAFVGVIDGRNLVRVEAAGESWLDIQDKVREVLNREWDPIGVAEVVDDEYDIYIEELYRLVKSNAREQEIADRLHTIEAERMGLRASAAAHLRAVAVSLRHLQLPDVETPDSVA
jgi:hypothetical protein